MSITKIDWLMVYRKMTDDYFQNFIKHLSKYTLQQNAMLQQVVHIAHTEVY
jgi:hypothetical protein